MGRKLSRREFLKMGVAGSAVAVLAGCQNPRRWVELEPYVQLSGGASSRCGQLVRHHLSAVSSWMWGHRSHHEWEGEKN